MMANVQVPGEGVEAERFWMGAIARWKASGLESMAEFCRSEGLPASRFYRWRQRLERCDARTADLDFLPVATRPVVEAEFSQPSSASIRLEIGSGLAITLRDGFDPKLLRSVVAALT